ncbi:hypothetical protein XENOCAPTIV_005925, partial [Xenoophorus captivus]
DQLVLTLLFPGLNLNIVFLDLDQLNQIMKVTGTPSEEFISKLDSQDVTVSVLDHMLLLDPEERVTAVEALSLPYFAIFREPAEETEAQPYDNSHEDKELTLDQWKRKVEEERS